MTDVPDNPEDKHVTRRELSMELRSFRNEVRVLIVAALVVLRFDVPNEITAGAIAAAVVIAVVKGAIGGSLRM